MDRFFLPTSFNPLNLITLFQFYTGVRLQPGLVLGFFFFHGLTCFFVPDMFNHRSTLIESGSKKNQNVSLQILQIQGLSLCKYSS